ncbi:hypothetical protein THASP1DRAFT_33068 [Thamnocephalis sphaerospora]|uniref:Transmembrane protein n=1 Tax=Thamnocephalis sphaerospora TaxID=78915 RepID=A0A4P9XHK5_9FUNG|nr:hypothetical protein THASP1DRAFT_33068 [Thamnocephalis sphaerospora]|eukprot:RKP05097.1 hypothetical protein THASP1DRAFT_33068 [Thamnocephalis sphaerospora]
MVDILPRVGGWNWDNMFAYNTGKVIQIRDRRLGLLRWVLLVIVWIYVLCDVFIHRRYNIKEAPVPGVVRASLAEPPTLSNAPSYCSQNAPCVYWSSSQILYPNTDGSELFLTTGLRFTSYTLPPNCTNAFVPGAPVSTSAQSLTTNATVNAVRPDLVGRAECVYTKGRQSTTRTYLVADVEKYMINVEHLVQDRLAGQTLSYEEMQGALVDGSSSAAQPRVLLRYNHRQTTEQRGATADVLPVGEILRAAGINLDAPSRNSGMVILAKIDYTNQRSPVTSDDSGPAQYTYRPELVSMPSAARVELRRNSDGTVTEVNRNGIRIVFQQTGVLGHFDFMALLIHLGTVMLLLALVSLLVEAVMHYMLPERGFYRIHKYDEISALKDANSAVGDDSSFFVERHSAVLASAVGALSPNEAHRRHLSMLRVMNPTAQSSHVSSDASNSFPAAPQRTHSMPPPSRRALRDSAASGATSDQFRLSKGSRQDAANQRTSALSGEIRDPTGALQEAPMQSATVLAATDPRRSYGAHTGEYQLYHTPNHLNGVNLPYPWPAEPTRKETALSQGSRSTDSTMVSVTMANPVTPQSHYNQAVQDVLLPSQHPPTASSSTDVLPSTSTFSVISLSPAAPPQSTVSLADPLFPCNPASPVSGHGHMLQPPQESTAGLNSPELPMSLVTCAQRSSSRRTYRYEPPTPARNSLMPGATSFSAAPLYMHSSNALIYDQQSIEAVELRNSTADITVHSTAGEGSLPLVVVPTPITSSRGVIVSVASDAVSAEHGNDNVSPNAGVTLGADAAISDRDTQLISDLDECFDNSDILMAAYAASDAAFTIQALDAEEYATNKPGDA